ncbi:RluA family pseudouridine synthase [Marinilabilia rubra]|nr:RluA family pseudouridine synthase [Marinilabilia rubra]
MTSHKHIVPSVAKSQRLSDYGPGIFPNLPTKSAFKKAIKKQEIYVNGQPETTGHLVKPGEEIAWHEPDKNPGKVFHIELDVVYEDEHLAVVNKPSGVVVSGNQFRTLENALPEHLQISSLADALSFPKPIHRLDAPTSGLIIIAKTSSARVYLSRQMEKKKIQKSYHAVVMGETPDNWESDLALEGKPAKTLFSKRYSVPSLRSQALTLTKAIPVTGRTHQIRKHLAADGFPILGDKIYGNEGHILMGKGLFLCATEVKFLHPETHQIMHLNIDTPPKFQKFMIGEEKRFQKYTDR